MGRARPSMDRASRREREIPSLVEGLGPRAGGDGSSAGLLGFSTRGVVRVVIRKHWSLESAGDLLIVAWIFVEEWRRRRES